MFDPLKYLLKSKKEEPTSESVVSEQVPVVETIIPPIEKPKTLLILARDKQVAPDRVFVVFPDVKLKLWIPNIDFFNKGKDFWGTMADVKEMDLGGYKELRFSLY